MNRHGTPLILAGLLFLAAAMLLTGYNLQEARHAETVCKQSLEQLKPLLPQQAVHAAGDEMEYPDYVLDPGMAMPVQTLDGVDYIGVLSLPDLALELPVQAEWSYERLKNTPCRYAGTAYQGNFVIAAHNYQRHFGALHTLSLGSPVTFTDMDGNVFSYEVTEVSTLSPTDTEEMVAPGCDLTLFTCTVGGRSRICVRCVKLK